MANAGPDQTVDERQLVNLSGSNSTDPDDGIASYHWVQIGEPSVILSDPNGQSATFTAPDVGTAGACLSFELTVTDHSGLERTDSCIVNVTWLNETPVANAGPDQTVDGGVVVRLDGTSSIDIDDGIASYLWTQIGVPKVTLSNPASSQPTFTAPNVEQDGASLNFDLTVTDVGGMQKTDSCIVNVSWQNEPPIAVVAPDYIEPIEGTLVALDGSASMDPDDGIASHLWTQVEGDPVSIADPTSAVATFTAPKTDQYGKNLKFKLTVKDFGGLQGTADSSIYVIPIINEPSAPANTPPTADYSFESSGLKVTFIDGSIDSDGSIVSWVWNFGDGTTNTPQNPRHRYRTPGTYIITLTVTDDGGAANSTWKTITVSK
jgi:PKD repeat protein